MDLQFTKVIVCSGHMIDQPNRVHPRFPPQKEKLVKEQILYHLNLWQIGSNSLAICSGAQGTDILFAECCLSLGVQVHLLIPLPQAEFLVRSVHLNNSNWEKRYLELLQKLNVSVFYLEDFLASNSEMFSIGDNIFAQNNLWIIHTAQTICRSAVLFAILVWDEKNQGDGPGGTADFAARIHQAQGTIAIINPTKL